VIERYCDFLGALVAQYRDIMKGYIK